MTAVVRELTDPSSTAGSKRLGTALRRIDFAVAMAGSCLLPAPASAATLGDYVTSIRPDFETKSIVGTTEMSVLPSQSDIDAGFVTIPMHELKARSVLSNGSARPYSTETGAIRVPIAKERGPEQFRLTISYEGREVEGLVFDEDHVYTKWGPCTWMVCDDSPSDKASITLTITVPEDFTVIASGREVAVADLSFAMRVHTWHQQQRYSSYLFGFAAGRYTDVHYSSGGNSLRLVGADTEEALRSRFDPTESALAFLQEKAGVPLPDHAYTQLMVPGREAQEFSSFSVIGQEYLDELSRNPHEDWSIVHELAHQWWGNSITCATWKDFWLNEGVVVFMVAAYKQSRWGEEDYLGELAVYRRRWDAAKEADFDVPLTYSGRYPNERIKRAIVYSKGALFLVALREELGEEAFWKGLKSYTKENLWRSVTSADFQAAMEKAAGHRLGSIFDRWVY